MDCPVILIYLVSANLTKNSVFYIFSPTLFAHYCRVSISSIALSGFVFITSDRLQRQGVVFWPFSPFLGVLDSTYIFSSVLIPIPSSLFPTVKKTVKSLLNGSGESPLTSFLSQMHSIILWIVCPLLFVCFCLSYNPYSSSVSKNDFHLFMTLFLFRTLSSLH